MLDQLETLVALQKSGTMAAAATRLRLTPSAISKRIALLEQQVGYLLVEPKGRMVELTPAALRLVERMMPLLAEIKARIADEAAEEGGEISLGVSESVLGSWGPRFFERVAKRIPGLRLKFHAHRSPAVVERVRSGEYLVGICAGVEGSLPGLRSGLLVHEPMVIVPSGLKRFSLRRGATLEVISIETHALTWDLLRPQLRELRESHGIAVKVAQEIESFACVVQLAKAGFGHSLVPLGIAMELGVRENQMVRLPGTVHRGVSWVARASTLARPSLQKFFNEMARGECHLK